MSEIILTWLKSNPEVIATILGGAATILGLLLTLAQKKLTAAIAALDATTSAIEKTQARTTKIVVSQAGLTGAASKALETSIDKVATNRVRI